MANMFNKGLSFFGLADPQDDLEESPAAQESAAQTDFEHEEVIGEQSSRLGLSGSGSDQSTSTSFPKPSMNRITTIHPHTYDEAQNVGRALREGVPVVLNLTDVEDKIAKRILDFSTGVVFALRGSYERVTPRVWLLSPAAVAIRQDQAQSPAASAGFFE